MSNKYDDEKISLAQCIIAGAFDELEVENEGDETRIKCPKEDEGCNGTLYIKPSRYGYNPYIGCTASKTCNYYTTIKEIKDRRKLLIEQHD